MEKEFHIHVLKSIPLQRNTVEKKKQSITKMISEMFV
jgi:hypothetical protein